MDEKPKSKKDYMIIETLAGLSVLVVIVVCIISFITGMLTVTDESGVYSILGGILVTISVIGVSVVLLLSSIHKALTKE